MEKKRERKKMRKRNGWVTEHVNWSLANQRLQESKTTTLFFSSYSSLSFSPLSIPRMFKPSFFFYYSLLSTKIVLCTYNVVGRWILAISLCNCNSTVSYGICWNLKSLLSWRTKIFIQFLIESVRNVLEFYIRRYRLCLIFRYNNNNSNITIIGFYIVIWNLLSFICMAVIHILYETFTINQQFEKIEWNNFFRNLLKSEYENCYLVLLER